MTRIVLIALGFTCLFTLLNQWIGADWYSSFVMTLLVGVLCGTLYLILADRW